jgi:hypothetical protein
VAQKRRLLTANFTQAQALFPKKSLLEVTDFGLFSQVGWWPALKLLVGVGALGLFVAAVVIGGQTVTEAAAPAPGETPWISGLTASWVERFYALAHPLIVGLTSALSGLLVLNLVPKRLPVQTLFGAVAVVFLMLPLVWLVTMPWAAAATLHAFGWYGLGLQGVIGAGWLVTAVGQQRHAALTALYGRRPHAPSGLPTLRRLWPLLAAVILVNAFGLRQGMLTTHWPRLWALVYGWAPLALCGLLAWGLRLGLAQALGCFYFWRYARQFQAQYQFSEKTWGRDKGR